MAQDLRQSDRILYQLLQEWLSQQEGGPELLADFERDPEGTALRLRAFLVQGSITLPRTLATFVIGGRVEKLVNIAQAGVVHVHRPEAEPTLTLEDRLEFERRYLKRVAEECRYLDTEGVDRVRAELTDVFVMLEAVESPRREEPSDVAPVPERAEEMGLKERVADLLGRREPEQEEQARPKPPPPPVPLSQALGEHRHLVILGEPGTGKTTTLQFVALCFATDDWAKARLELDEVRLPVRVALREYDGAERLDRFLIEWLDRAYVPKPLAQDWLAEGRLTVLLDGLDEVPEARRAAVVEAVERFAATPEGQRCRVVVTSRIAGYRERRSLGADLAQYTIHPFAGPQDAQPYAAGWLRALKPTTPEAAEDEAKTLLEAMEQQGGLRRVMSNPLLLRLAVAIYVETGELARSRAELYRRYVEAVAWKRAEAREQPRWSRKQIEATLEAVAWALQTQGEQTVAALAGVVEEVPGVADGQELLDYLRERLGLLAVYGYERGDLVAFRHLTFQEHFVAQRLKGAWEEDLERAWLFLRPRLHHPAWQEPVLLWAAMLEQKRATELVGHILKAESPYERELHRDLLLAGECLGSGSDVNAELRRAILDELLQLYLKEIAPETTRRGFLVRPIETIFDSLGNDGRAEIMASLLTIVNGRDKAKQFTPTKIAANLALAVRAFVHFLIAFLYELVETRSVRGIREVTFIPTYFKQARAEEKNVRRRATIKALGNLKFGGAETITMLLVALEDVSTRAVAAEALGKVGPGTDEVVMALIDVQRQHRHVYGWDQTVAGIIEALGILGQRYPEVVELLLGIVNGPEADPYDIRYAVTYALCKSAETDPLAMAFVLEGWQILYKKQLLQDGQMVLLLDEGIREGLKDGRKLISSASPQVIRHLLNAIQNYDDSPMPNTAWEFLARVVGDTPLVQCKEVEEEGSLRSKTLDLTEELFDMFLQRPKQGVFGDPTLGLLVRWGLNRPELIVRLINVVRKADAWLLANILEMILNSPSYFYFKQPVNSESRTLLEQAIARLRSPDKATRDTELNGWLVAAQSASEDSWFLTHLPDAIEKEKCQILHDAYASASSRIWAAHERSWSKQPHEQADPHVVAALACFRGWRMGDLPYLTVGEVREEFLAGVEEALSVLQIPDKQIIEIVSPIVAGEAAKLASSDLERELDEKLGRWRERSRPDFQERSAAAYALAQLADDYPEAQAVLISNLKPRFWCQQGTGFFPETEFQEHLIRALGCVKHANRDLLAALLEIATKRDEDVYWAGSEALSRLQHPDPETVPFLIQGYSQLDKLGRPGLLRALGTVEPPTPAVAGLLLSALRDKDHGVRSAAATELGNLKQPDPRVIDALLASTKRTITAAEAIGKLADRITSTGGAEMQARLAKAAGVLRKALRRGLPFDPTIGGSGYDVAYEALDRIVARLTELEVAALGAGPPLFARTPVEARPSPALLVVLSTFIAALSGLASNIVAAYLQDRYYLISDAGRFGVVVAVFVLTLIASIGLALRREKQNTN